MIGICGWKVLRSSHLRFVSLSHALTPTSYCNLFPPSCLQRIFLSIYLTLTYTNIDTEHIYTHIHTHRNFSLSPSLVRCVRCVTCYMSTSIRRNTASQVSHAAADLDSETDADANIEANRNSISVSTVLNSPHPRHHRYHRHRHRHRDRCNSDRYRYAVDAELVMAERRGCHVASRVTQSH